MLAEKRYFKKYGLIALIVLLVLVLIGFVFFKLHTPSCSDTECFFKKLVSCQKANFFYVGNITFDYTILGKDDDACLVDVTFIRSYWRGNEFESLKGKSMLCELPYGKVVFPEEELSECHGSLKESLQGLILNKLHGYIIDNLAQ
jgi:hypothetical protein